MSGCLRWREDLKTFREDKTDPAQRTGLFLNTVLNQVWGNRRILSPEDLNSLPQHSLSQSYYQDGHPWNNGENPRKAKEQEVKEPVSDGKGKMPNDNSTPGQEATVHVIKLGDLRILPQREGNGWTAFRSAWGNLTWLSTWTTKTRGKTNNNNDLNKKQTRLFVLEKTQCCIGKEK